VQLEGLSRVANATLQDLSPSAGVDQPAERVEFISVDDHVIEPANLWTSRIPAKYHEIAPHIVKDENGIEIWHYEDKRVAVPGLSATAGLSREQYSLSPVGYASMREGAYDAKARIADMDLDGVLASISFPSFPRFCGQIFSEASDPDLALLCVRAYNDWMIDEWCATAPGRLIPMGILPLWDVNLAATEATRVVDRGGRAICFSENPSKLGLPSIHNADDYWHPLFATVAEADVPLCMHMGSSSTKIITAPDAKDWIMVALGPIRSQIAMVDWLFSGQFVRHPNLKTAFAEGGIGWIPNALERSDYTWEHQGGWTESLLTDKPSSYFKDHVYGCFIDDVHGIENLHKIGEDNVMMESDYPHSDSTWPNSAEIAAKHLASLSPETRYKVTRGNAQRLFKFTASGIGEL
jgi:predicted TIM-barrel fold metal-dependent hydrolase